MRSLEEWLAGANLINQEGNMLLLGIRERIRPRSFPSRTVYD